MPLNIGLFINLISPLLLSLIVLVLTFLGNQKQQQILIVKGTDCLELLKVDASNGTLSSIGGSGGSNVFGVIRSIAPFRLTGSTKDYVILGTDSGRISVLEWNDEKSCFVRIQCETFGKTGIRRGIPGLYLATDPKGRAVMIGAAERAKFVYILNRDAQSKLMISSPLDSHRNHTICFAITGVDVGYDNPIYASLEVDFSESDHDHTGKAFNGIEKQLVYHELDLGLNHVVRKWNCSVDRSAHYLIPVPGGADGPSGVLVCSEGWIGWYHVDSTPVRIPIPTRVDGCDPLDENEKRLPIILSHAVHKMKKQFFILVQTDLGDVFKVTMDYEVGTEEELGQVQALKLKYFETLPVSTSLCLLKSGFLFLAAQQGDHLLYQIENLGDDDDEQPEFSTLDFEMSKHPDLSFYPRPLRNLSPVDQIESAAPLIDAVVANLTEEDTPQIYALTGRKNRSAFTILRHGLAVSEIAASELPGYPNAIWTVRGSIQDEYDSYIIISFVNATLVLSIGESVEEVTDTGILTSTPTLSIGQLGDDALVQVYPGGIRHIRSDRRVSEWKAPPGTNIIQGTSNNRQVCIALSNGQLVYFEVDSGGNLNEFQDRVEMGGRVLSIAVSPIPEGRQRGQFLAIACDDNTVRVLSLDPSNCLERVSMQALSSPAESLVIVEMIDPSTSVSSLILNMGLSNGVFLRTTIDNVTGVLSDTRQRFLGPKSVKLYSVSIAGSAAVLALSVRPWLSYNFQSSSKLAPLSYEALDYGCGFASEQAPEGIVAVSGNTLRILAVEKLHQRFNHVTIKLKYTPRRMLLHPTSKNFVVLESEHQTPSQNEKTSILEARARSTEDGSIPEELEADQFGLPYAAPGTWASCIRYLNPFSGDTLSFFELENNEAAISCTLIVFASNPQEIFLVVGTVTGLVIGNGKKTFKSGGLKVFKFIEDGNGIELLHHTDIDGIPQAIIPFQGRLLIGVGRLLRIYELGKKKLLRKCESKDFPSSIIKLHTQGDRIITTDASESIQYSAYRHFDNKIVMFADDPVPKWMTTSTQIDYDTMAGGDKFGNFFVLRLDPEVSKAIADDKTGNLGMYDRGKMQGAAHKLTKIASIYFGETVTSITKTPLVPGGRELLVYTTFSGSIGILIPFASKEDVEFFQLLEMTLRQELEPLSGRHYLAYRSSFMPVQNVVDGELCELFNSLPNEKKRMIAEGLDRSVSDVSKKLDDIRQRVAF